MTKANCRTLSRAYSRVALILACACSYSAAIATNSGTNTQYEYSPVGVVGTERDQMIEQIRDDVNTICGGMTGPQGEELPDVSSLGDEVASLFNLWWFGDEWTLAEYRESRNQPVSRTIGQEGHQAYFDECVASLRAGSLSTLQMEAKPWMVHGELFQRERGERPCSTTSKAGYTPDQVGQLQSECASMIDVHFPVIAYAHTKSGEPVECEVQLTICMIWDAEDERWEAAQVTICGYPDDLRMTSPIF